MRHRLSNLCPKKHRLENLRHKERDLRTMIVAQTLSLCSEKHRLENLCYTLNVRKDLENS